MRAKQEKRTMGQYDIHYGKKYSKDIDIVEIAKLVRAYIKEAVSAGDLPAAKYGVRIERYSGGRSLNIDVKNGEFPLLSEKRVRFELENPNRYPGDNPDPEVRSWMSVEAQRVQGALMTIAAAYNFDGSDIQSDYFHVNFYVHVRFDHTNEEAERNLIRDALEAAKAPKESEQERYLGSLGVTP